MKNCHIVSITVLALVLVASPAVPAEDDAERLVAAMLSETPLIDDLRELTDRFGGRATGSKANEQSVAWAIERFRAAGVDARAEPFEMPELWLEKSASATVEGDGVRFSPRVAGMPFSAPTPEGGLTAPVVDAGAGEAGDFARLGDTARGAFALISLPLLEDIPGLFAEYIAASAIEERAFAAGVAGLIYMGSRPGNQLYRHNASYGIDNEHVMVVVERDAATRMLRLIRSGTELKLSVELELFTDGPFASHNVIGEIRGSGQIVGFVTSGRLAEMQTVLDAALEPVAGLGPFSHTDAAFYGTDHFDFVLEGVPGLFADQESANYGPHYHARSDTFDKVDQEQLRLNAAIAAAFVWGYANAEIDWGRLGRADVQKVIDGGLGDQMRAFRVMKDWASGSRGRQE